MQPLYTSTVPMARPEANLVAPVSGCRVVPTTLSRSHFIAQRSTLCSWRRAWRGRACELAGYAGRQASVAAALLEVVTGGRATHTPHSLASARWAARAEEEEERPSVSSHPRCWQARSSSRIFRRQSLSRRPRGTRSPHTQIPTGRRRAATRRPGAALSGALRSRTCRS